ncbi:MAG: GGDEF domain-containing protein [Hoeflea sp.]|uniref:GGDEF domain-containing protein n=1 Tax=Hoeflea sp. TaxID=1940281 RepID=UPI0032EDF9D8
MIQSGNIESVDPAETVITKMREQGISSLPRNYELVYRFLNSSNPKLILALAALGQRPSQVQLDAIGMRFLPHHYPESAAEQSLDSVYNEMLSMIRLFKQDQSRLRKYSYVLGETSTRMSRYDARDQDGIHDMRRILSSATCETLEKSESVIYQMVEQAKELTRLKSELEEYKRLCAIDPVTRLANRRAFDKRLSGIYDQKSEAASQALIIADIDHFKAFNDTYGHQVGDRVLSATAAVMKKTLGSETFISRTGGEEFAIILEGAGQEVALKTAERVREAIASTPLKDHNDGRDCGRVTISLGLCMATDASGPQDIYNKADAALYDAKKNGRNRVKMYSPKVKRLLSLLKQ